MKNTFFKVLALTLTLIMAMSIAVQASPELVKGDAVDGVVTVNVTGVSATDEVTLLVVKAETDLSTVVAEDIYYIDQATAVEGAAEFSFAIDTAEFDVYSGYSSMAVDALPLSALYTAGGEGGDDPVVEGPTVDEDASILYENEAAYDLDGYRRVFIKLTEENGAWTPAHADADSAIFYAPEVEGYDGLVKTTSADLTSILNEITWENAAPSTEAIIAMYGDLNGDGEITAKDYRSIKDAFLENVTYTLKEYLMGDTNDDTAITAKDYREIKDVFLENLEEFTTVANKK